MWRKFLTLPGLELRSSGVQPVASRYTDYAIPSSSSELNTSEGGVREKIATDSQQS
jgi:hypothetical protein